MGLNIRLASIYYLSADQSRIDTLTALADQSRQIIRKPFVFSGHVTATPLSIYSRVKEMERSGRTRLSVLIDYKSFDKALAKDFATVIRDTILCYPEINFLFDERAIPETPPHSQGTFLDYLIDAFGFDSDSTSKGCVNAELHCFRGVLPTTESGKTRKKPNPEASLFDPIIRGKNNLFDASNLRFFLKTVALIGLWH